MREGLNTPTGAASARYRPKVTDAMIDAGEKAFEDYAVETAIARGEPIPDFEGMPEEAHKLHREAIKRVIAAGVTAHYEKASQ